MIIDKIKSLLESPRFNTLKKHTIKLDPEEREQALAAKATMNDGSCRIKKSKVDGKVWYWSQNHRVFQASPTLKGALHKHRTVVEPAD